MAGCGDVRGAGGVAQWLLRVESSSSASEGAGGRAPRRGDQGGPQGWEGHLPANEDVRHAVEPMIEGDAIVDVDLRVPPLGQLVATRGQWASSTETPLGTRASLSSRCSRLFSRSVHSRSTSRPIVSSVESGSVRGVVFISRSVDAIVSIFISTNF